METRNYMPNCCKGCEERTSGCSSECKKYLKNKEVLLKKKQWLKEQNERTAIYASDFDPPLKKNYVKR